MNCMDVREMLSLYMDNELNEEETIIVANHLKNCEACQSEYNELKQLHDMLQNLEEISIPKEFDERLKSAICSEIEKQKIDNTIEENENGRQKLNLKKRINYRRIYSIAAIFVIGIFTVLLYNNSDTLFPNNEELNIYQESSDEMATKEGKLKEIANDENSSAAFGGETIRNEDSKKSAQDENTSDSTENISDETISMASEPLALTEEGSSVKSSKIAPKDLYQSSPIPNQEIQDAKTDSDSKVRDTDEKALYEELIQKELSTIEYQITKTEKQENNSWLFIIEIDRIDKDGNKTMEIRTYKGENGALSWIKD